MSKHSRCKYCAAPIRWVRDIYGQALPVDAEPFARVLVLEDELEHTRARSRLAYRDHRSHCPNQPQPRSASGTAREAAPAPPSDTQRELGYE